MASFLAHGELVVVETDDDRYLGTAEVVGENLVIRSGYRGHPVTVALEDVESVVPASDHRDCVGLSETPVLVRKQYSVWPGSIGLDAWDVDKLHALAATLPVEEVNLGDLGQIDSNYWYDHGYAPTVRSIAERFTLMQEADLSFPIILSPYGRVMDGMHRVLRALVYGHKTISAVRLRRLPPPDYRNCDLQALPYER